MRNYEDPRRTAVIRCLPGKPGVKFSTKEERHDFWRYHEILLALLFHGEQRFEAEEAAMWCCRYSKVGEKKEVWPGMEIEIVGEETEDECSERRSHQVNDG